MTCITCAVLSGAHSWLCSVRTSSTFTHHRCLQTVMAKTPHAISTDALSAARWLPPASWGASEATCEATCESTCVDLYTLLVAAHDLAAFPTSLLAAHGPIAAHGPRDDSKSMDHPLPWRRRERHPVERAGAAPRAMWGQTPLCAQWSQALFGAQ